jgi:hypothetical protein
MGNVNTTYPVRKKTFEVEFEKVSKDNFTMMHLLVE